MVHSRVHGKYLGTGKGKWWREGKVRCKEEDDGAERERYDAEKELGWCREDQEMVREEWWCKKDKKE
jgi:hypothetical protein